MTSIGVHRRCCRDSCHARSLRELQVGRGSGQASSARARASEEMVALYVHVASPMAYYGCEGEPRERNPRRRGGALPPGAKRTGGAAMPDVQRPEPRTSPVAHARASSFLLGIVVAALVVALVAACAPARAAFGARSSGTATVAATPRSTATPQGQCPPSAAGAAPACPPCPPTAVEPSGPLPCLPCPPQSEGPGIIVWCIPCTPEIVVRCVPCPQSARPCPVLPPTPTASPVPRSAGPVILFCPPIPVAVQLAPGTIVLQGMICGGGFQRGELVTFTATGPHASISWQVVATSTGTVTAPLSPLLCQLVPATITATGNRGSHTNTLVLATSACEVRA